MTQVASKIIITPAERTSNQGARRTVRAERMTIAESPVNSFSASASLAFNLTLQEIPLETIQSNLTFFFFFLILAQHYPTGYNLASLVSGGKRTLK